MSTFALIHGGGGTSWDWHLVSSELREQGHDPVAVDLPSEDESAGWREYVDTVGQAVGDRSDLVVVGHSLGGFTAPLVCARVPAELLVLVAAMIPSPGELLADWWTNAGYEESGYEALRPSTLPLPSSAECSCASMRGVREGLVYRRVSPRVRSLRDGVTLRAWSEHSFSESTIHATANAPATPTAGVGERRSAEQ